MLSCAQTEPPLNPPENREYTAEVMFETFNVPGLHIGVQAVLALTAALAGTSSADRSLSGTVIDSGDGGTHIIPVSEGYVIGGAIRHIPLAGRDITAFVQRSLRERGEAVPPEDSLEVARRIKEEHWCAALLCPPPPPPPPLSCSRRLTPPPCAPPPPQLRWPGHCQGVPAL